MQSINIDEKIVCMPNKFKNIITTMIYPNEFAICEIDEPVD